MKNRMKILLSIFLAFFLLVGCKDTFDKEHSEYVNLMNKAIENYKNSNELKTEFNSLVEYFPRTDSPIITEKVTDRFSNELTINKNVNIFEIKSSKREEVYGRDLLGKYQNIETKVENNTFYIKEEDEYYSKLTKFKKSDKYYQQKVNKSLWDENYDQNIIELLELTTKSDVECDKNSEYNDVYICSFDLNNYKNENDVLYNTLLEHFTIDSIENLDKKIKMRIQFNLKNEVVYKISYDLSDVIDELEFNDKVKNSEDKKILEFEISFNFIKYNDVEINEPTEEQIIIDAPNSYFENIFVLDESADKYLFNKIELTYDEIYEENEYGTDKRIEGSLDYKEDVDCYKINIDQKSKFYFQLVSSEDLEIEVYDTEGNYIRDFYYQDQDGQFTYRDFAVQLDEGAYYIEVSSYEENLEHVDYWLEIDEIDNDDIGDSVDESVNEPKLITEDTVYEGEINYFGDIDVFEFDLESKGIVFAVISTTEDIFILDTNPEYQIIYRPVDNEIYFTKDVTRSENYIAISSDYFIGKYTVTFYVFDDKNDMPDLESDDLPTFEVGESIIDGKHKIADDNDYFMLNVTESASYLMYHEIVTLDGYSTRMNINIYDSDGNLVYNSSDSMSNGSYKEKYFYLDKGQYIVSVNIKSTALYLLFFDKAIDDNHTFEWLNMDNTEVITFNTDFREDFDSYKFIVNEPKLYNFSLPSGLVLEIFNEDGFRIHYNYNSFNNIYLFPGIYTVRFNSNNIGEKTVNVKVSEEYTDDYIYKSSESDDHIGTLLIGDNLLSIEYYGDQDSYMINITEAGYYSLDFDRIPYFCFYYTDIDDKIKFGNYDTIYLEEGVYYFDFIYYSYDPNNVTFNLKIERRIN